MGLQLFSRVLDPDQNWICTVFAELLDPYLNYEYGTGPDPRTGIQKRLHILTKAVFRIRTDLNTDSDPESDTGFFIAKM